MNFRNAAAFLGANFYLGATYNTLTGGCFGLIAWQLIAGTALGCAAFLRSPRCKEPAQ